jgi:hypothetical protein
MRDQPSQRLPGTLGQEPDGRGLSTRRTGWNGGFLIRRDFL